MRQFMKGKKKKNSRESLCCASHRAGGHKPPPLPALAVSIRPTLHSIRHTCSTSEAGLKHTAQLRLALLSPGGGESVVFKKFSHVHPSWPTVSAQTTFRMFCSNHPPHHLHSMGQNKLHVFPSRCCKSETHCLLSGLLKFLPP